MYVVEWTCFRCVMMIKILLYQKTKLTLHERIHFPLFASMNIGQVYQQAFSYQDCKQSMHHYPSTGIRQPIP